LVSWRSKVAGDSDNGEELGGGDLGPLKVDGLGWCCGEVADDAFLGNQFVAKQGPQVPNESEGFEEGLPVGGEGNSIVSEAPVNGKWDTVKCDGVLLPDGAMDGCFEGCE
jgi:hypothetical protein